jgi:hypothetical protein
MALAKYINASLRGTLGEQVYSRNLGGDYVRSHGVYSALPSVHQTAAFTRFNSSVSDWSGLSEANKINWRNFVPNSDFKNLNSYIKFLKFNYNVRNGLGLELTPVSGGAVVRFWSATSNSYCPKDLNYVYTLPSDPPKFSGCSGFIVNDSGTVYFPKVTNPYLRVYGLNAIQTGYRLNFAETPNVYYLKDIHGYHCGLFSVISDPTADAFRVPKNKFNCIVGFTYPINYPSGFSNCTQIQLTGFCNYSRNDLKIVPVNGNYSLYSLYSINIYGEVNLLHSEIKKFSN